MIQREHIPRSLLLEAKQDPFTGCHVSLSRKYVAIRDGGRIVGFCDPRRERVGWRMGPLYVGQEHRRKGLAAAWVRAFPHRPMVSFIVFANEASAAFHRALGFEEWRRNKFGIFWRLA